MTNLWDINSEGGVSEGGDGCLGMVSVCIYVCLHMGFCFVWLIVA